MNRRKKEADQHKGWNISISGVFIAMVMGIVLISVVAATLIFVQIYRNAMEQSAVTSSSQSCEQVQNTVENYTQDMRIILEGIVARMRHENNHSEEYIQNLVNIRSDVVAVTICGEDGELLRYWNRGQKLKENYRIVQSTEMEDDDGRLRITKPYVESLFEGYYPWVVTVYQKIQKEDGTSIQVNIDIRFSDIANYVDDVGIGQHGYAYIADKKGNLIYHPQQQLIYSGLKEEKGMDLKEGTHIQEQAIYTVKNLENCDWKIVGVCYVDEMITEKVSSAVSRLLIVLCLVMGAVFLLGWAFSELFSAPVRQLADDMHRFEKNAENFVFEPMAGTTEITTLSNSFEHMVVKIQKLMEQVRQEEITLRKTELKALQAQINPHFLYNTLDIIVWMIENEQKTEAVKVVTALARFFRISLSRGKSLITVKDELEHVRNYLMIQQMRFKNKFTYTIESDDEVLELASLKLMLQPLVENAIYHGMEYMDGDGEIFVRAWQEEKELYLEVRDNGLGMTEEQVESLFTDTAHVASKRGSGIGVRNVNERIKLYFGAEYGLSIESEPDEGTAVKIHLPAVPYEKVLEEKKV
mgnify:CR=1 FL=1